ncbi:MAG: divalent-cation tolerance protein CutA [Candidatus Omnitrophica bacterium]|nr:divalent-cation tolerance protein CutA [Candidatus Omnitrophota bacterium]MBU4149376.1 divalent-cation tolerance protein CutA [Candidatus Omnitrophota bacterium]
MQGIIIFITAADKKEAKKIAGILLKNRLVACANLIKDIESYFWWQGKKQKAKECLIVVKTKKTLLNKVIKLVSSIHSYECPEIIAVPVIGGHRPYMDWIEKETYGRPYP